METLVPPPTTYRPAVDGGARVFVIGVPGALGKRRCADEERAEAPTTPFLRAVRQRVRYAAHFADVLSASAARALKRRREEDEEDEAAMEAMDAARAPGEEVVSTAARALCSLSLAPKRARVGGAQADSAPRADSAHKRVSFAAPPQFAYSDGPSAAVPPEPACAHNYVRQCECGALLYTLEEVEQLVRGVVAPSFERALEELARERAAPPGGGGAYA